MGGPTARVVVVGGGVAGLTAAALLRSRPQPAEVLLLEAAPVVGGALRTGELGGVALDDGAESMLASRPEALRLLQLAGLEDQAVRPDATAASVLSRGRLRPMPSRTVLGVPSDVGAVAGSGVLSWPGVVRLAAERLLPPDAPEDDQPVGRYVASRLGREVVDRLVEPLLGGVYAGLVDELSFQATLPGLAAALPTTGRLLHAASVVLGSSTMAATVPTTGPVPDAPGSARANGPFLGVRGGLGSVPPALAHRLQTVLGAQVRTGTTVRGLERTTSGWRVLVGPAGAAQAIDADAVILAVPATAAARLLAQSVPRAATELRGVQSASVALVWLSYPHFAVHGHIPGAGALVPAIEPPMIKAVTVASQKWGWVREADRDLTFLRVSVGRFGGEEQLQRDDAELVRAVAEELGTWFGVVGAPLHGRVVRWGGALPQYTVGHLDRVRRLRQAVAAQPGLGVCGAALDGVGVPAVVASAHAAVDQVLPAVTTVRRSRARRR